MSKPIYILGEIGGWGTYASDILYELQAANKEDVEVILSSPGGSISEGVTIYNLLKRYEGNVDITGVGTVASIATIILLAAKKENRKIEKGCMTYLHDPLTEVKGNAKELRVVADVLDRFKLSLVDVVADGTGMSREQASDMMDKETWLTPEMAIEYGFASSIEEPRYPAVAKLRHNLGHLNNIPSEFMREGPKANMQNNKIEKPTTNNNQEKPGMDISKAKAEDVRKENPQLFAALALEAQTEERNRVANIAALNKLYESSPEAVQKAVREEIDKLVVDPVNNAEKVLMAITSVAQKAHADVVNNVGSGARDLGDQSEDLQNNSEESSEEIKKAEHVAKVSGLVLGMKSSLAPIGVMK